MIGQSSRATLNATATFARLNGMDFHLTAIPTYVDNAGTMMFDTEEMRKLYAFGEEYAQPGHAWFNKSSWLAPDGEAPLLQSRRTSIAR